jgi:hypothetical protein
MRVSFGFRRGRVKEQVSEYFITLWHDGIHIHSDTATMQIFVVHVLHLMAKCKGEENETRQVNITFYGIYPESRLVTKGNVHG